MGFANKEWPTWQQIEQENKLRVYRRQKNEQYRVAVSRSASALRFWANEFDTHTPEAKQELLYLSEMLSELELCLVKQGKEVTQ